MKKYIIIILFCALWGLMVVPGVYSAWTQDLQIGGEFTIKAQAQEDKKTGTGETETETKTETKTETETDTDSLSTEMISASQVIANTGVLQEQDCLSIPDETNGAQGSKHSEQEQKDASEHEQKGVSESEQGKEQNQEPERNLEHEQEDV